MRIAMKRLLYWTPRILGICMAGFLSIVAADVFGEGHSFWETLGALFMHLVPTIIVLIALAVAWRWETAGALLFIGLAVFYIVWVWGRFPWITYLVISGPLFLTGALFLLNGLLRGPRHDVPVTG
jgi:hypothetical protein